jgi:hypothetical protein
MHQNRKVVSAKTLKSALRFSRTVVNKPECTFDLLHTTILTYWSSLLLTSVGVYLGAKVFAHGILYGNCIDGLLYCAGIRV